MQERRKSKPDVCSSPHTGTYTVGIFHWCVRYTAPRKNKQTKSDLQLTHSKTRINPRGNFSTWNVPIDASCTWTQREKKGTHFNHQLTTRWPIKQITHTLTWSAVSISDPDSSFFLTWLIECKHTPQTARQDPTDVSVAPRLSSLLRVRAEKPESSFFFFLFFKSSCTCMCSICCVDLSKYGF